MKLAAVVLSALVSTFGFGQNISTEAPSVSASAVTVPAGFLQAELSTSINIINDFPENAFRVFEAPFLLARYGLTERFELRMQSQNVLRDNGNSYNYSLIQLGIGVKYAILPNDGNTNLSVIGTFSPRMNDWKSRQADLTLAFSQALGARSSIGVNVGGSYFNSNTLGSDFKWQTTSFLGSAVYGYQILDKLTAFGEFYYSISNIEFNDIETTNDAYGIDFGLQYLLRENIQIDYVSGFNLSNKQQFHSLGFNIYFKTR
jgi:hypothetical protein